jgi:chromosome partitioning protein
MGPVLTQLGRKGGIGRTTTTFNLAGVWVKEGARVLCVDLDSQASLSRCLLGSEFVETTHPAETLAGVFDERYDVDPEEVIRPTAFKGLTVLPACDALERYNGADPESHRQRQFVLRDFLRSASAHFDIAICDTGPNSLGALAKAALCASQFVISPVPCDTFGTQSIISVQRLAEEVQTTINPSLEILGYYINMRQKNTVMNGYEDTLRKVHGTMIFDTVLPLAAQYRQAVAERTPLPLKKGSNIAVKTLFAFAGEINDRICRIAARKEAA